MKKRIFNILFFFSLILLTNSFLPNHSKANNINPGTDLSKTRIAPSVCQQFINKIIENYDLVKEHDLAGYTDDYYGFTLQKKWNPDKIVKATYSEKNILGGLEIKRNNLGNVFVRNIFPNLVDKLDIRDGDEIISINNKKTKNYSNEELEEIFDKENEEITSKGGIEIEYIDKNGLKKNTKLITHNVKIVDKFLDFEIKSFNFIDPKTFTTEFRVLYGVAGEVWDGINRETEEDELYKIANENFAYYKDGKKDFSVCGYTDDEINQMQIFLPSWAVKLLNLSYESKDTYKKETEFEVYEEDVNAGYSYLDVYTTYEGIVKTKNKFDLRTFPFDKQQIIFNFAETSNPDVRLSTYESVYSGLYELSQKENLIPGWKLTDVNVGGFNYQIAGWYTDAFASGISIVLEVEREFQYYLFKIIFPIILILIVCWSVFWIDPTELESKLTITIVCLLSLIAYNFVVSEDIPKLPYLTIMDYIILISYIYATLPNFLSIASYHLIKNNSAYNYKFLGTNYKITSALIDRRSRIYGPLSYVIIVFIIIIFNISGSSNTSALLNWLKI